MRNLYSLLLPTVFFINCKEASVEKTNQDFTSLNQATFVKADTMNKEEFWKIINYAYADSGNDRQAQAKLILNKLITYSPRQIVEFELIFRQLIIEADDFKVMAAEKIIEGWVTDDSYLYFRCWLIGQGQTVFTETLRNPDYLADNISVDISTNFEDLMYIATKAYSQTTGKKDEDENFPRSIAINKGLNYDFGTPPTKGTDWTNDQLPKLYPKLWAKFH